MLGVSMLANICTYCFYGLLLFVLLFGGETKFIVENGFSAMGRLAQNYFTLSTYTDPLRKTGFAQNWTIFYWAYWLVWCVAAPFFIGSISRGRTIRQTILGGYVFGMGSTFVSFIILGNYGLGLQVFSRLDIVSLYEKTQNLYSTVIAMIEQLPLAPAVLVLLIITMIAFYATSFDSIALVASQYTYRNLGEGEEPAGLVKAFWSILLILLPVALVFSDSSMANLQSVSIIAAFPIGFVILLITASFIKDAGDYLEEIKKNK
jgi:BCCT family betaine/carnitine transporter